jgi:glycosyltransferase involved in cell wall biosynthesis
VTCDYYATRVAKHLLADQDIFVGYAGQSLAALKRAKELGAVTVVERHSAHIDVQMKLLAEEHERYGVPFATQDAALRDRELEEYAAADFISVPSEFVRRSFIDKGFAASRILKTPLGANLSRFTPGPKQDAAFRVLYCGSMSLQKGVPYLIQAFQELGLPHSELVLVGDIEPGIRRFLQWSGTAGIRLTGRLQGEEYVRHFRQSDVFVLPSIQDGFGMVVPEAMACGLPVIATENSCGPDVIREGKEGFVIPIRNVEKLKEKITWLYEHSRERAEMGLNALARVKGAFTWDVYGAAMVEQYQSILSARQLSAGTGRA